MGIILVNYKTLNPILKKKWVKKIKNLTHPMKFKILIKGIVIQNIILGAF